MFGCVAYTHISKDERKKLDPKAAKHAYGASRKGYHFYDRKTLCITHSRDIVFKESSRAWESEEMKKLVQVESISEEEAE